MVACAVDQEEGASTSLRQYFQAWDPEGEEDPPSGGGERAATAAEEAPAAASGEHDVTTEVPAGELEERDDIVDDKRYQLIWKTRTAGLEHVDCVRRGKRSIATIWTTPGVTKERMVQILQGLVRAGRDYYLYTGNRVIWRKLQDLHREGRIGGPYRLVRCAFHVTTITDAEQQRVIARDYHVGKTNHRGPAEMIAALRRRYYWEGMRQTVDRVLGECDVCGRAKVATRPPKELQELTPTAEGPLRRVEVDTYVWRGHQWVTPVDTFSKVTMAYEVRQRPAEAVVHAIRQWSQVYGVPDIFVSDCGTEFRNVDVEAEARRLGVTWHYNTPGHPQGRGCVERLHRTLGEHLRLYAAEHQLEPLEAMSRAVVAYNHSVHTATGYSPVEVLFGVGVGRRDPGATAVEGPEVQAIMDHAAARQARWGTVRRRILQEKERRVLRHNVRTTDVTGRLAIGSIVYRRLSTNRRKEEALYAGPCRVVAILEHNRYTVEDCRPPGRRRTVHLRQLKLPRTSETTPEEQREPGPRRSPTES